MAKEISENEATAMIAMLAGTIEKLSTRVAVLEKMLNAACVDNITFQTMVIKDNGYTSKDLEKAEADYEEMSKNAYDSAIEAVRGTVAAEEAEAKASANQDEKQDE